MAEEITRVPLRSEQDPANTWATEDLFATPELWEAEYTALGTLPETLAAWEGRLTSGAALQEYLDFSVAQDLRLSALYRYASLRRDEDTADSAGLARCGKAENLLTRCAAASAWETPELLALSEEQMEQFYAEAPGLELYRRRLTRLRRMKEHVLSAAEEALLAAAGEMAASPDNTGSAFRDADMKFPPVTDRTGKVRPLTQSSFIPMMQDPDREVREQAFRKFYEVWGAWRNTAAALLDGQMKQLCFYSRARKYPSTLAASLDGNEVPVEVYHNLISAVHDCLPALHRYVALRKKWLGLPDLHYYDLYVPMVTEADRVIPFGEAKETVLEALAVLGEDYTALLREGFDNRWIDVYENVGKRSGAYSSGGRPHPYVLLNHKDDLDSMFTLAHEMGHALHSYLSCKHQPPVDSGYVIFVAEVASTCNEVLLMQHLLKNTTDKQQRAYLINHFLESFRGTVYRQTMFAEFELFMGRMAEQGETLTAEALCAEYAALNAKYYGPEIAADPEIAMEWARIPHFFYDYYVFQYATGFSAAIALAMKILKEGAPAVEKYKQFLSSGGSADPITLLRRAGVDMASPQPVQEALAYFDQLIAEMEALL